MNNVIKVDFSKPKVEEKPYRLFYSVFRNKWLVINKKTNMCQSAWSNRMAAQITMNSLNGLRR